MYQYNNLSDREFDELTIRWSALKAEVSAAKARQKQAALERIRAAIWSAAAVILIFCW
ncbi:MAG: hypothetical protein IJ479_05795 [Alphaproteobacteria bacterium]|nr:hypothetical protein [Alphaproteobacteria bacterium]